ncbi:nucleotide-sugar transporter-domain-containing protein [Zychaea mexicana]|uniref:nucleotide-sugar transporter-domain-containing protein n=1 Tax=Zychaea mexicana TaxID=64656 RepID=UPI0022FF31AA|nr:nucleotide-sugar transporter-domain-containing protein [Zychaea mexicana]KAI9498782.1 nucleotide-sugar transporter-domain-containing protein [Zychaea mexicana]
MMRYSRVVPRGDDQPLYIASTAVVMAEIIKLSVCLIMLRRELYSWTRLRRALAKDIWHNPSETIRLMIPSALYAIQNNLLYLALSNLEAATFQITYQLKILSTAIFSQVVLNRRLSQNQWVALGLLMGGVTLVQITTREEDKAAVMIDAIKADGEQQEQYQYSNSDQNQHQQNAMFGLIAVLASCVSSGFAGCYFERMLKTSSTSMWMRNIQMGLSALAFSIVAMLMNDYHLIRQGGGLFQGYTMIAWLVIANQALGGLLVATVVKHADNILKNFATSVSIILSSIISFYFFDFRPSIMFVLGAMLVTAATYFYGIADRRQSPSSSTTTAATIKPH